MGLDAGQESVQTAVNASTVADGALTTVTAILQRMRTLVVEGRGAILSDADRADINDELSALGAEIDRIAQNTNFNGRNLLDGSASAQLATAGGAVVARNDTLSSGLQLLDPSQLVATPTGLPVDLEISVDSYDPSTGLLTVSLQRRESGPGADVLRVAAAVDADPRRAELRQRLQHPGRAARRHGRGAVSERRPVLGRRRQRTPTSSRS